MRRLLTILGLLLLHTAVWAQTAVKISGKVTDSKTGEPLSGAAVSIRSTGAGTFTDQDGNYALSVSKPGKITVVVTFVGYSDVSKQIDATGNTTLNVAMAVSAGIGDEVVVSASKRPEKITRAPASISVITAKDLEQSSSFNIGELASKLQGVEFVRTGVNGVGFNARGFNNAFNAKILQMTDGRNSMMAGGSGLPVGIMNTVIKEDVERFEVVLGPNSALYGPNAHNGIANTITKDPRKYQGTTLVLGGGNQEVFSGRFRTATKINNKWAYKLTGEYTTGKDFEFRDSVYVGGTVFGPATSTPERVRTFQFRHMRGEAHLYYSVDSKSDLILSYGGSTNNFLAVNNVGRNQIRDWRFSYLQGRYVSPRFFAQLYYTWTNVGSSYGNVNYTRDFYNRTRSTITDPSNPLFPAFGRLDPDAAEQFATRLGSQAGAGFKEMSGRLNAEAQYNWNFDQAGVNVIAGLNYQNDRPNTFGTSLADGNQLIRVTQLGAVLQVEKTLPGDIKLVGSARWDDHSVFGNLFAPKFAFVKGVPGGSFRVTWGRANAAPIILFQSANVFGIVFGNGDGVSYIPNGGNVNNTPLVTDKLKVETIGTWEVGYKGQIGKKFYIDINGYYGNSENFLSPAISVGGRALRVGNIPVTHAAAFAGTTNSAGVLSGGLFQTYFNYGQVAAYGVDLGTNVFFSDNVSWALKYSWFGSDIEKDNIKNDANRDGYVSLEEKSLNAPKNRIATSLNFSNLAKGKMFLNISARWVQQFDFYSGSQIGTAAGKGRRGVVYGGINPLTNLPRNYVKNFDWGALGGFTTIDLSAGYKVNNMVSVGAGISNLFNVEQREFVGSPSIGRLFSAEIKVHVPNSKK
jgi:iron complex outermembrane receptor protein